MLLGVWFVRAAANERGVLCESDGARIEWLASYDVTAEPALMWEREATVGLGSGWDEYLRRLDENGFDISPLEGRTVTVHCYMGIGEYEGCHIRTVSLRGRAIGYEFSQPIVITDIH